MLLSCQQLSLPLGEIALINAQLWLDNRPGTKGFEHESAELEEVMEDLRDAITEERRRLGEKKVRLLWIPQRVSRKHRVSMPSVDVVLAGQVWINEMRTGRARVRDNYHLLVGGRVVCYGSRRYVMRQADWLLMCDPFGHLPEVETARGVRKRRLLYKLRKMRKRSVGLRVPRYQRRRFRGHLKGRHGDRLRKAFARNLRAAQDRGELLIAHGGRVVEILKAPNSRTIGPGTSVRGR